MDMKRLALSVAATVAFALPLAAQATDSSATPLDAIVAIVGNVPITRYDLEQRLADSVRLLHARNLPLPSAARQREIVLSTLNTIVDEEVLLAKAKEMSIEVSD